MEDFGLLAATELLRMLDNRELTSVELTEHLIDRHDRLNGLVNATVTLEPEQALRLAAEADDTRSRGDATGPLHGLPMTIKDALNTAGIPSTGGVSALADNVPAEDAEAVSKAKSAGALILGKTNVPEWCGDLQTHNSLFGTTNNPWDTARTPGGSSGGAAAALAMGLTPLEIGTDVVCSVRLPAHFTGTCGHKPSFGIVPQSGLLYHPAGGLGSPDINAVCPMARTVADVQLLFDVLVGPADQDSAGWRIDLPSARGGPRDLRVGAWLDDVACPVSADMSAALEAAVAAIESDGTAVDRSARPDHPLTDATDVGVPLILSQSSAALTDDEFERTLQVGQDPNLDGPVAVGVRGATLSHRDWVRLDERRQRNRRSWSRFFKRYDVLLAPVCIVPAIEHNQSGPFMTRTLNVDGVERSHLDLVTWTVQFGYTYLPATVVPIGFSEDGLPVGIQIVGPYLEDRTVLTFAAYVESLLGGFQAPAMALR